jgi:hypothetical protein
MRCNTILALIAAAALASPALATFHLMHIEQLIVGVDGDATAQAIQLRMRSSHQGVVLPTRLVVRDAAGANPIVLADLDAPLANEEEGDRVLIASPNMALYSEPHLQADFAMTRLIPTEYFAAGTLTFETDDGTIIVSRLSWGGAAYTGPTEGALANADAGDFGDPVPAALPTDGTQAHLFQTDYLDRATSNAADFAVTRDVALTNNAGVAFQIGACIAIADGDGDGWCDHIDNCPDAPNNDQSDVDEDGVGDACDACPDDPDKQEIGDCGCGVEDTDANANGVPDCDEAAPAAPRCGLGTTAATLFTLAGLVSSRRRRTSIGPAGAESAQPHRRD